MKAWQVLAMARGKRPDLFSGSKALRGKRKEAVPLTASNIQALKVFVR
jgi:hypothetical protein